MVERDVPPVGEARHQLHRSRTGAADHDGDPPEWNRELTGTLDHELLTPVVDGLTGPEGGHQLERLAEPLDAGAAAGVSDTERVELAGDRARADPELEPAAGEVVERHCLPGEHRGVSKRVAEHQMSEPQTLGHRGQPGRSGERLEHRLVGRAGRCEVIHEGHPLETRGFRGPRTKLERLGGEAHLGEKEVESETARHVATHRAANPRRTPRASQTRSTNMPARCSNCWPEPPIRTSFCFARLKRK